MIDDERSQREKIREIEERIEKNSEGNQGIPEAIRSKYQAYTELCGKLNESKMIEITEKNGEFSFTLKEPVQRILKGREEKKVTHENLTEQADPEAFLFLIGRVKALRNALESGNRRKQFQVGSSLHRQKSLGEEKLRMLKKLKESESCFDLLNKKLNDIKKEVKTNMLEPIRIETESGAHSEVKSSQLNVIYSFKQKVQKKVKLGSPWPGIEWKDDLNLIEGLRGKLAALTFYYKAPKLRGVFADYVVHNGRTVEGSLYGQAEGDEFRMNFKAPEKPQIIQARFNSEGIVYLKLTSNFSSVLVVGDNAKYAKHTSQFKTVLKDSETLGCLSCAVNNEDFSIMGLNFDIV